MLPEEAPEAMVGLKSKKGIEVCRGVGQMLDTRIGASFIYEQTRGKCNTHIRDDEDKNFL